MFELLQMFQNGMPELSAAALFFIFFFGTFVSEDATCLLAGTAVASGRIGFALALSACFLGIFVSDLLVYSAGRAFGNRIFESRIVKRFVPQTAVSKASAWLQKNGASAVFVSRFVSGSRLPTYLLAGALRTNFAKFAFYFLLASAVWTPILVGSTAFSQAVLFPGNALLGIIVIAVVVRIIFKYSRWKNRRLLVGRFKRIANWEFWPIYIFYAPVVLYIIWLGLRHRSPMAFTAVNPALPAGGVKGESKDEIYAGLKRSDEVAKHMLAHILIPKNFPYAEKLQRTHQFVSTLREPFPLVVKPNAGERGKNVKIVRSSENLELLLRADDSDLIIQEFTPGKEVSIFYYRHPDEEFGHIFSITEKKFPFVIGNGSFTLEELILSDSRAICLASKYFIENADRLHAVPDAGEQVRIIEVGTHSRGAIFMDGERFFSEALEKKIDAICRGYDGFYFGRFDIRTRSYEDLAQGKNFKIIELNGVTSESTNIYDPKYTLTEAYRILFDQWRIAFEIGMANLRRGFHPVKGMELVRLVLGKETTRTKIA